MASAGLTRPIRGAAITVSRSKIRAAIRPATPSAVAASGKLTVDGAMGPRTTRAIQRWVGTPQDGDFGPRSVMALQRKVGVRPAGAIDRQTIRALQARIGARRCVRATSHHRHGWITWAPLIGSPGAARRFRHRRKSSWDSRMARGQ